ncbi:MAG TPA: hypothetical protein VHM70_14755 [Polyangiaceae bacterium]|nr:hypothetical protein [Polyangiaceae bacterium]
MLPVVAIEVQAPAQQPEMHVDEMLAACTRALSDRTCSLSEGEQTATPSAVVTWNSETEVTIAVGDAALSRSEWTHRKLRFDPADEPSERWRSVGLTTALMVGEREAQPATSELGWVQVNGLLLTGTGLANGARVGAGLGAAARAFGTPLWFAARFDYTTARATPPDLDLDWLTLGLGLEGAWDLSRDLGLELELEGLAQHVTATASRGERTDEASQWQPGGRARLGLVWPSSRSWAGVVSAEGSVFDAPTAITRQGEHIADIPRTSAILSFGVRFRP